jgi:hypothetical protein
MHAIEAKQSRRSEPEISVFVLRDGPQDRNSIFRGPRRVRKLADRLVGIKGGGAGG